MSSLVTLSGEGLQTLDLKWPIYRRHNLDGPPVRPVAKQSHSPFDAVIDSSRLEDGAFSVRSSKVELISSNLLEHRTQCPRSYD